MPDGSHRPLRQRLPYGTGRRCHPEAYNIWFARDSEPKEAPAFGMRALLVLDDETDKSAVLYR
jgi:hypothetical protein